MVLGIYQLHLISWYSILCSGSETEQGIFEQVLKGELDFVSEPWPSISEGAKDLVRRMLIRDPKKRLTAHEVLCKYACLLLSDYSLSSYRWFFFSVCLT